MTINNHTISYKTRGGYEFEDITDQVVDFVSKTNIKNGIANIQSLHTTTAVIVNENEPLLVEDMKKHLKEMAPREKYYAHNDFSIRTEHVDPIFEPENGHSHCVAAYLPTSVTLNVIDGILSLGTWQRIFHIELDQSRDRQVQIQIIGE
jgi:secondary thiamine-phosphate synthase enzyme